MRFGSRTLAMTLATTFTTGLTVTRRAALQGAAALAIALLVAAPAAAKGEKLPPPPSDNYDVLFKQYLDAARATPPAAPTPDSLWMAGLMGDFRARRLNDLVTVRVIETVSAQGSADSSLDKNSSGSAATPSLLGLESKFPGFLDPSSLASISAKTKFSGSGSTTRTGSLSAVLSARVAEVLPNGDLALEGVREIEINGDRQIVVLTGVVRTVDVGPGNVVPSTAIGQMRIRYFGRGLIKDNLQPGLLVRILNKVF
jgi:flagellar L-ring protein precursor FlgH